jgi:hypothetical protein
MVWRATLRKTDIIPPPKMISRICLEGTVIFDKINKMDMLVSNPINPVILAKKYGCKAYF